MIDHDEETARRLLRSGWSELKANCVITTLNVIEDAAVAAIAAALAQTRAEERERNHTMWNENGDWFFRDGWESVWKLKVTGDPDMPLIIEVVRRRDTGGRHAD